ncbi:BRE1-domain-containing protein [Amylocystis lapponica]|nr:BRE1-domain-containing protein [Amylocystis lapponica]
MESRKRPHAEDAEESLPKKRAVGDDHTSPGHLNGVTAELDEPKDSDNLEAFRKDAIFRRMKYYSREHERSQARVAELERRRHTCEAGLAALEACWTQTIDTIRLLAQPGDLPSFDLKTDEIFDLTAHISDESDPEYVEMLREKMHATSELVTAFPVSGGTNRVLHSSFGTALARMKLRDIESQKDRYREQLITAEMRLDRLQSKPLAAIEGRAVREEVQEESPQESPASPAPSQPVTDAVLVADAIAWRKVAESRQRSIESIGPMFVKCQQELFTARSQLRAPTEDIVKASPYYLVLKERMSMLERTVTDSQKEITRLKDQVGELERGRQEFEENLTASSEKLIQDCKNMLARRDTDNLRLREQRDQYSAELNERKARDHTKLLSLNECKTQLGTYTDRIKVLESEVTRLKTRLAAAANDEDLMSFLFRGSAGNATYLTDLKSRITGNTGLLPGNTSRRRASYEVRSRRTRTTAQVKKQLERYQSVYGNASSALTPDVRGLAEQLQQKEEQCQKLRLQEKQREQAESALYAELDKLSAAWEVLDRQVNSKVFDLSAMEERVTKSGLEKAKAENKFYAALRDKEALEAERKNLSRTIDKQAKAVEKLVQGEKVLLARVSDMEREVSMLVKALEVQRDAKEALEKDNAVLNIRVEAELNRHKDLHALNHERERKLDRQRAGLQKELEALVLARAEAEKYTAEMKASSQNPSGSSSSKETQLQLEVDKCMKILKCSTCNMNMRNTVITKCMHSFCKSCVESRISTRQRKCPACNLPFSQGEVQTLFFQ